MGLRPAKHIKFELLTSALRWEPGVRIGGGTHSRETQLSRSAGIVRKASSRCVWRQDGLRGARLSQSRTTFAFEKFFMALRVSNTNELKLAIKP